MNLNRVAEMIQEINKDMAELNNKPMAVEYFRVCQRGECVKAVMEEAAQHGGIVCFKGEVTVIMPRLMPGWTQYGSPL